jgi:hypothetical protein
VATLGTILISRIRSEVVAHLSGTPLAVHSHTLATAISAGGLRGAIVGVPASMRGLLVGAAKVSYVDALNTILLVGAGVAFVGMVVAFTTIRQRDFHESPVAAGAPASESAQEASPLAA